MDKYLTEMALSGNTKKDAEKCYNYANNIVNGKVSEHLEKVIAKNAYYAYRYALDVIKGRFELGEPTIARSANWSYYYAVFVLRRRFELGEPAIRANSYHWDKYKRHFNIEESKLTELLYKHKEINKMLQEQQVQRLIVLLEELLDADNDLGIDCVELTKSLTQLIEFDNSHVEYAIFKKNGGNWYVQLSSDVKETAVLAYNQMKDQGMEVALRRVEMPPETTRTNFYSVLGLDSNGMSSELPGANVEMDESKRRFKEGQANTLLNILKAGVEQCKLGNYKALLDSLNDFIDRELLDDYQYDRLMELVKLIKWDIEDGEAIDTTIKRLQDMIDWVEEEKIDGFMENNKDKGLPPPSLATIDHSVYGDEAPYYDNMLGKLAACPNCKGTGINRFGEECVYCEGEGKVWYFGDSRYGGVKGTSGNIYYY